MSGAIEAVARGQVLDTMQAITRNADRLNKSLNRIEILKLNEILA